MLKPSFSLYREAWEAVIAGQDARGKIKERLAGIRNLEKSAQRCWSQCTDMEDKIAKIPAKSPDDLAAKITIHYYLDARDALLKALAV